MRDYKLCFYVWFFYVFTYVQSKAANSKRALVTVSCCLYDNMNPSVMSPKKGSKIQLIIPQPPATCWRMTLVREIGGHISQQHSLEEGLLPYIEIGGAGSNFTTLFLVVGFRLHTRAISYFLYARCCHFQRSEAWNCREQLTCSLPFPLPSPLSL